MPDRCCVSCRKLAPKSEFWRIVRVFPSYEVKIDQGMGRSVYLCRNLTCLQQAEKKDRLSRALKITVPKPIYETLHQQIAGNSSYNLN
ncbi:MAG: YlxR family protein [Synechococcales bacterium]|nr:YlxR family protein [Synechococcales bacterium]